MKLKGVLLDIDGTLLDSNRAHAAAWQAAYEAEGISIPLEKIMRLIGMGRDHLMPQLSSIELESDQGKRIGERRGEIFRSRFLPYLKPFPYAHEFVQKLHESGLKCAIATSAKAQELEKFLELLKIQKYLNAIVCADDVQHSKPAPDMIHVGRAKLGLQADELFMVGDTPYDIEAAAGAGVRTIAVRCGGWSNEDLREAYQVFADPAEIFRRFEETPFFLLA